MYVWKEEIRDPQLSKRRLVEILKESSDLQRSSWFNAI